MIPIMSQKVVIRPNPSFRGQPLLRSEPTISLSHYTSRKRGVGEVIGGATAECVAVCCCFPFGVADFLALILYKIPISFCKRGIRRMLKKKKKRRINNVRYTPEHLRCCCGCDETEIHIHSLKAPSVNDMAALEHSEVDEEAVKLEADMWRKFHRSGFCRSPSQWDSP